jgi:hypothetical protein
MGGYRWSKREVSQLRRMAEEGATIGEAAEELGRTRGGTAEMVRKAGITFRNGRPVDLDKRIALVDLIKLGYNLGQCARLLNVHPRTAWAMANRLRREGVLTRIGGPTNSCRYLLSASYTRDGERANRPPTNRSKST